jgi:Alr-MurF fusion protein
LLNLAAVTQQCYTALMISLYDVLEASNGQLFGEPVAQIFTGFCLDSRQAKESELYVALKSDQGDTHQYIEEAIGKGVSGVICNRPPECDTDGVSVIITRDVSAALMSWAHYFLGKLGVHVIGVTGSSGKSAAVEAIAAVLGTRYKVHKSSANADGPLSIPLSLARLDNEHKMVVLKLGTTQPGEMGEMIQAIQPEVGVITHVDHYRMDRFDSLEQFAQEAGQLIAHLSPTGLAALNYDNDLVRELPTRAQKMTFGTERFGADLMAYNIVPGPSGTGFDLRCGSDRQVGRWMPLLGKHQLFSIMAALAVGQHYDVPLDKGLKALSELKPLPGQMNPLSGINNSLLIDDTYAATLENTLATLDWLEVIKDEGQHAVFIMGDIDNLGAYSRQGHRQIGHRAAEVADVIITDGVEAAAIGRAASDQGMDTSHIHTTYSIQDAVTALKANYTIEPDDIILVKGGATTRMEPVVEALLQHEKDRDQLVRQGVAWTTPAAFEPVQPSWIEIDTDALANNVKALKETVGDAVTLMAVVKANAYGHGAVTVAQTALLNGAEYLGVATINEALELRDAGISAPILVMSYTPTYAIRQAIRQNIAVALYDLEMAWAYDRAARDIGGKLTVHVKIDTGMGRLGVATSDGVSFFRHLMSCQNLEIEGIYTHLSMADEKSDHTDEQLKNFKSVLLPLRAAGFNFKYIHTANSAATLTREDSHFNMVRVGLALYGVHLSDHVRLSKAFKPIMAWKTVVAQVRTLPAGHPVGYGNTYHTKAEEQIAILPVGYADGFRRLPNWGAVLIHGQRAPIVGRVSMEKTAVNVSHIPGVAIGDEVVLLGQQDEAEITAVSIAARLGTIVYEVLTTILPRMPRR